MCYKCVPPASITNEGPNKHNVMRHDVKTRCLECPATDCGNFCTVWWMDFKKHLRQVHPDFRILNTNAYMKWDLPPFILLHKCPYCKYAHYKKDMVETHKKQTCVQRAAFEAAGRLSDELATRPDDVPPLVPDAGLYSTARRGSDESDSVIVEDEADPDTDPMMDMGALAGALVPVAAPAPKQPELSLAAVAKEWLKHHTPYSEPRLGPAQKISEAEARSRDTKSCEDHILQQKKNVAIATKQMETLQSQLQVKPHLPKFPGVIHEVNAVAFLYHRSPSRPEEWISVRMALDDVPATGTYGLYQGEAHIDDVTVDPHARNSTDLTIPIDIMDRFVTSRLLGTIYSCDGPWILRARIRMVKRFDSGSFTMLRKLSNKSHPIQVTFLRQKDWPVAHQMSP